MELEEIRKEIDLVNADLVKLIEKRMDLVQQVTAYKRQHHLSVLDTGRQQFILEEIKKQVKNPAYSDTVAESFEGIMAASRNYQSRMIESNQYDKEN